ncbi:MAG: hypothetical protein M3Z25_09045 [Actinomycetota bacterium]|nr:hypothetical protein [Actinomycetota bacterium]
MNCGVALVLGAATPLAASAVVGTMAVAARTVHAPSGFFIVDDGSARLSLAACVPWSSGAAGVLSST